MSYKTPKPAETVASHPVHTHTHTHIPSRSRQPVEHLTMPMLGSYYSIWERAGERERHTHTEKARQREMGLQKDQLIVDVCTKKGSLSNRLQKVEREEIVQEV